MNLAALAILSVLPLAAPPKLLDNAKLETVSAASGLDALFRARVSSDGWIGYSVPLAARTNLGCDYVSPGGWTAPGVIHLEPPDHAVILFRAEAGAVTRIRVLSPDCEIDAGGAELHWIEDVHLDQSTALLRGFATAGTTKRNLRESAIRALAASQEPGALEIVIELARKEADRHIRQFCVSLLAQSKDPRAAAFFRDVLR